MAFTLSDAWKEAIASVDAALSYVEYLKITHSTFASDYNFSKSDTDLEINNVLYKGVQFEWNLPAVKAQTNGGISLKVSNVTRDVIDEIEVAYATDEPILVYIGSVVAGQVSATASFTQPMEVSEFGLADSDLSLNAGYPDTINKKVPSKDYTTKEFIGLRN